jgi:hypothetical protein
MLKLTQLDLSEVIVLYISVVFYLSALTLMSQLAKYSNCLFYEYDTIYSSLRRNSYTLCVMARWFAIT